MLKKKNACFLLLAVALTGLAVFFLPAGRQALAQAGDLGTQCAAVTDSNTLCPNMSPADCKVKYGPLLEQCANYYDQQSAQLAQDLTKTSAQKDTLQSAIKKLKSKIQGLEADINQGKIMVKDLNIQISDTQDSINKTTADIQDSQNQIENILRSVYEEDQKPAFVVLLQGNLSDFFSDLTYLDNLNSSVSDLLDTTKNLKLYLSGQQIKMSDSVDQLQKTMAIQTLQKQQNQQAKQQQDQYLQLTETQYELQQKTKAVADAASAKIKAMLFQVVGVTQAPTFGEAIDIAKAVSNLVPIRPAFLLAIISQESALGKVVGNCVLTDIKTGAGKKITTGAYMSKVFNKNGYHPNDLTYFLQITSSVGRDPLDPSISPISCDGYGSMGPAQFLPTTWIGHVDKLKTLLGKVADPWVVKDSFTASALHLSDLGAGAQTTATEKNAAYHYNGSGYAATKYSNYVMYRASCIQSFIDNGAFTYDSDCERTILGS